MKTNHIIFQSLLSPSEMPHSLSVECFSLNKSTSYQSLCLCLSILSQRKKQEPPIHWEHVHFLKSQWRFSHDTCQMTWSHHEDALLKLLSAPLGSLFDSALRRWIFDSFVCFSAGFSTSFCNLFALLQGTCSFFKVQTVQTAPKKAGLEVLTTIISDLSLSYLSMRDPETGWEIALALLFLQIRKQRCRGSQQSQSGAELGSEIRSTNSTLSVPSTPSCSRLPTWTHQEKETHDGIRNLTSLGPHQVLTPNSRWQSLCLQHPRE